MKKYNVAIIDDQELCIKILKDSLSKYSNIQVIGEAKNPDIGKLLIMKQHPDLVFLDVEMPNTNGLELLREIRDQINWPMQIVFYTAYDKYLLEALRESAFDYLLKPFEPNELEKVMNRFFDYSQKEQINAIFQNSINRLFPERSSFMVATILGYRILRSEQIGYFTYQKNRKQWAVILSDLSQQQLKRNTCAKDILKYSPSFVQINQQQIININYLAMITDKSCLLCPPFDKQCDLSISRGFYGNLQERFSLI